MKSIVLLTREDYSKLRKHDLEILIENFTIKISEPISNEETNYGDT